MSIKDSPLLAIAGQELDNKIAQIMGIDVRMCKSYIQNEIKPRHARSYGKRLIIEYTDKFGVPIPKFSTSILAAWSVFEFIYDKHATVDDPEPTIFQIWRGIGRWHVAKIWLHHDGDIQLWSADGETAALAICRAALLAESERP